MKIARRPNLSATNAKAMVPIKRPAKSAKMNEASPFIPKRLVVVGPSVRLRIYERTRRIGRGREVREAVSSQS